MTWLQVLRLARKKYGLKKLVWNRNKNYKGSCAYWEGTIYMSRANNHNEDLEEKIWTLFHELGHIHCFENGRWPAFHHNLPENRISKKLRKKMLKTGLKAERWVDNWGRKEAKKYFPEFKFKEKAYYTERSMYRLIGHMKGFL